MNEPGKASDGDQVPGKAGTVCRWGLIAGPLAFAVMLAGPAPGTLDEAGWHVAAVAVWMVIWWVAEAIPIPATALLPVVLFPLLGTTDISGATAP